MSTSTATLPVPPESGYTTTKKRVITRRGVLWLGQTCNLRCHFCYFLNRIEDKEHPEHPFMSLDKAKAICATMVNVYGNNAIDIQGGEPTVYKEIYELVAYCREIGLIPTLITNALALASASACQKLKEAGIRDLLISIQGIGDVYDEVVCVPGAYKKQIKGLENAVAAGIPIRFNCVLSKPALPQLKEIAEKAVRYGARAVNFLAFNPFEDQQLDGKRSTVNVPRYSEVVPHLNDALDILAAAGIEANVRYFPMCMVKPEHRKSMYNFQQLSYDIHEWDYASWSWTGMQAQRMKWGDPSPIVDLAEQTYQQVQYTGILRPVANTVRQVVHRFPSMRQPIRVIHEAISRTVHPRPTYTPEQKDDLYRANAKMRATGHCRYAFSPSCEQCAAKDICDGLHGDYAELFGTDEVSPMTDLPKISDPKFFIAQQDKVVEPEDYDWAL